MKIKKLGECNTFLVPSAVSGVRDKVLTGVGGGGGGGEQGLGQYKGGEEEDGPQLHVADDSGTIPP